MASKVVTRNPEGFYVTKRHILVEIRGRLEELLHWEKSADAPDEGDLRYYAKMLRDVEDDLDALEPFVSSEDDVIQEGWTNGADWAETGLR
jgi:hypothetical protein